MKRIISFTLACALLLSGCNRQLASASSSASQTDDSTNQTAADAIEQFEPSTSISANLKQEDVPTFNNLNDSHLLQYVEDTVYAGLVDEFSSEDYIIENVSAIYYSKEYLEEVAYNSKANIFFGYTLAELDEQFQGERYVFTLSDDGETTVQPFEDYDDTYERVIKNVAIGTGVILVCVTVSVVTGGAGVSTVSMVLAASAKTGTTFALSAGGIGALASGIVTGVQTHDFDKAVKVAALVGSEGFKWGAISGALIGGLSEAHTLRSGVNAIDTIPSPRQSELDALEKYGGREQVSFVGGQEVPYGTPGSTRPDIVRVVGDHLEVMDVKNYNLESSKSLNTLYNELERQVSARVTNCPPGTTQRIVLDVRGRNFNQELISSVSETIEERLIDIYPNIPIDILGL